MKHSRFPLLLLVLSHLAVAADFRATIEIAKQARDLASKGEHEASLEKYVGLHESARAAGGDDRLLVVYLADWHFLGLKYPPALERLTDFLKESENAVLNGSDVTADFSRVRLINDQLKRPEQTFDLYRRLAEKHPQKATECFAIVQALLVPNRAYQLYEKHCQSLAYQFQRWELQWNVGPKSGREHFIKQVRDLIEVAIGVGKPELAAEFQKRAVQVTEDKSLETAVEMATKRVKEKR